CSHTACHFKGGAEVSDELDVGPEDLEALGLDPAELESEIGRKDFLFNAGKLMAAAAASGPFFMAAKQAAAAEQASLGKDPIATTAAAAAKKRFSGVEITRIA